MPIKPISSTSSLRKELVSSQDTPSSFAGKQVRTGDQQGFITETKSYSGHDEIKDIHDRSIAPSDDGASFITSDGDDDTTSFHSAVEFLEDKFPTNSVETHGTTESESSQINSADYHQARAINKETVKDLENANHERLNQYIRDFTDVYEGTEGTHGITADLREPLYAMVNYGAKLDKDMQRLEMLGQKLQNQGLSKRESLEMKALMNCNKYNLSFAQGWISATMALRVDAGTMNEPTATLLTALSNRLATRHMNLADTISLYEDRLPAKEPLSRRDRIEYSLLTARAGLRAFDAMMRSQKNIRPNMFVKMKRTRRSLEKHCIELEQSARLARGRIKIDVSNPQLELESPDAWTEDFDLVKNKGQIRLPPQAAEQLSGDWNKNPPVLALRHPHLSQRDILRLFITFQLKREGIDVTQLPKFETIYEQALITEINQGEWPIIDKSLQFNVNGNRHTCRSTITPGRHLVGRLQKPYKDNGISYADRLQADHAPNMAHTQLVAEDGETLFSGVRHGILDAYDYDDKRVRNFSDAQLTRMAKAIYDDEQHRLRGTDTSTLEQQLRAVEDSEDDGQSLTLTNNTDYWGGVGGDPESVSALSYRKRYLEKQITLRNEHAQEIVREIKSDPKRQTHYINEMRNLASRKMAREVLSATVVSDPAKLQAALDGKTIDVTMNSVALVTPDWLRHIGGFANDERRMLKHQTQGLQSLASGSSPDNPLRLTIKDDSGQPREIKVNLKVRTFNFGVNDYAVAKTVLPSHFPVWRNLMGWGFSAALNDPQLEELLGARNDGVLGGAVADKLQKLEQSDDPKVQKRAVLLRETATQARQIWKNRSFWSGNNEPYKMVSRLALTSHLMGETSLFNCKSGKDRTGQLDAEVKYLAAVGHATGHIPEPDSAHTAESRKMRTTFTLDTGNLEMQRMNTGLPGYKLRNIPGLKAMLEQDTQAKYEGGSDLV